jgi:hypothetical protein
VVRYLPNQDEIPVTQRLSIIELDSGSTRETKCKKVMDCLFDNDYDILFNLVGICIDSSANMISKEDKGLTNRLQNLLPSLVHVANICHLANTVPYRAIIIS